MPRTYTYRPEVLEELARHGLRPLPATAPERLRDAVRDLYLFEIRRLRADLLRGRIVRADYAGHVIELRKRYPLLSLPTALWVEVEGETGGGARGGSADPGEARN